MTQYRPETVGALNDALEKLCGVAEIFLDTNPSEQDKQFTIAAIEQAHKALAAYQQDRKDNP